MFPEAGGSSSFARHAFNELVSFIAGWALSLDYILTIAISAFFVPHYLGAFWPALDAPAGRRDRRDHRDRLAGLAEHPGDRRVGEPEPDPRRARPRHPGSDHLHRRGAGVEPVAARPPGRARLDADVLAPDLRAVAGDARLHRDRDRLEHGRGGGRPGPGRAAGRQLHPDRRARRVRGHDGRRAVGAARARPWRPRLHAARRGPAARLPERPGARDHLAPRARDRGHARAPLLRRRAGGDDPVHRHQRGADRDLAALVVAGRAPAAADDLLASAPSPPDAVVHDRGVLGVRGDPADPGQDRFPRQPLLVRRDAVVHDRPRRGDRVADQGSRPRAALPDRGEHPLPGRRDPGERGDRRARHVRGLDLGPRAPRRRALRRHRVDGGRARSATSSTAAARCST